MSKLNLYKSETASTASNETLNKMNQLKVFIDASLKAALTKEYETQEAKIEELCQVLYVVRDHLSSYVCEHSLRYLLMQKFIEIDDKDTLGN